LLALAALAGGAYAWYHYERQRQDERQLVLQGNIDVRQVNLAFKVDGRIASLAVDEGNEVKAGQVIATLDKKYFDDDLRVTHARRDNAKATLARLEHGSRPEEIASAKAQVAEQRAALKRTEQDFERAERLVGQGAVSRESFDQARSALDEARARLNYSEESERMAVIGPRQEDIDAARAQLAAEEAAVVQSERRQADSDLIAPSDGIILTRAREKGAIVAAGETVFTLTLSSPVWVRTYVNETDLGKIHPGMAAAVTTDSQPDKSYPGRIGFISPVAEFTPKTVETRELRTNLVYRLRVLVDNPDNGLRQGMPVTVTLDLTSRD
jgi:HlyD family secretion protein